MKESAETILQRAEYLTEIERFSEAIPLLLKAIAQNPQNFHANCLLSFCYSSLKDYEKGLEFAEKAIAAEPEQEWGHRLRSIVLTETGRKKEALKSAEEAVRLAPYEQFALQTLIYAYLNCGKAKEAKKIALEMRELFPETDTTFFTLGNIYLQLGYHYEAEKNFREALRLNPASSDARNNLGVTLLRQTQAQESSLFKSNNLSILNAAKQDEVHSHFTEAIKLEPNHELAAENLKNQFSYFNILYGFLILIPFFVIAFFIAPLMTILMTLLGIYSFVKLFFEVRKMRKQLSPEMKIFLKSSARKNFRSRIEEFSTFVVHVYKKTWKPHALALLALIICYINFSQPAAAFSSRTWNQTIAYILIIVSAIWLQVELRKD